jgi:hypothetical protein
METETTRLTNNGELSVSTQTTQRNVANQRLVSLVKQVVDASASNKSTELQEYLNFYSFFHFSMEIDLITDHSTNAQLLWTDVEKW